MMTHVSQDVGICLDLERHAHVPPGAQFPHALSALHALDAQPRVSVVGQQLGQRFFHLLAALWLKFPIYPPKSCGADKLHTIP
ncbi:MAG: hypothetical protein ACE5FI_13595, partial [Anaerolineales bacterium]